MRTVYIPGAMPVEKQQALFHVAQVLSGDYQVCLEMDTPLVRLMMPSDRSLVALRGFDLQRMGEMAVQGDYDFHFTMHAEGATEQLWLITQDYVDLHESLLYLREMPQVAVCHGALLHWSDSSVSTKYLEALIAMCGQSLPVKDWPVHPFSETDVCANQDDLYEGVKGLKRHSKAYREVIGALVASLLDNDRKSAKALMKLMGRNR